MALARLALSHAGPSHRAPSFLLLLLALVLLASPPGNAPWVAAQRTLTSAILVDFDVLAFSVETSRAHQVLRVDVLNSRYLVMRGQVVPPGASFQAETPARHGHLLAALLLLGAAALLWRQAHALRAALLVALPLAALLLVAAGPLVLAGQVWGLGVDARSEPSLAALLVALSAFLLNGGGYLLVLAGVAAAGAVARPRTQDLVAALRPAG